MGDHTGIRTVPYACWFAMLAGARVLVGAVPLNPLPHGDLRAAGVQCEASADAKPFIRTTTANSIMYKIRHSQDALETGRYARCPAGTDLPGVSAPSVVAFGAFSL